MRARVQSLGERKGENKAMLQPSKRGQQEQEQWGPRCEGTPALPASRYTPMAGLPAARS